MIKYFEISTGTPPLYLAESKEQKGVEIISWIGSEFYKGESAENAVLYEAQHLTSSQQLQARTNIGLANVDNTRDENKPISTATQQALEGKQDTLTLTTLSNGNIRIGNLAGGSVDFMPATPSGDPMHYAYEAAGAVWNTTTQLWEVAGVSNLTTNEIRAIYPTRTMWTATTDGLFNGYPYRAIFTPINNQIGGLAGSIATAKAMCMYARQLEVFSKPNFYPQNADYIFYQCVAIHTISLNGSQCTSWSNAFIGCAALENANITGLKANISFADSPNLSKASILYMVQNAGTATITITLHATAYAMAMADSDIQNALAIKTNVSLASA